MPRTKNFNAPYQRRVRVSKTLVVTVRHHPNNAANKPKQPINHEVFEFVENQVTQRPTKKIRLSQDDNDESSKDKVLPRQQQEEEELSSSWMQTKEARAAGSTQKKKKKKKQRSYPRQKKRPQLPVVLHEVTPMPPRLSLHDDAKHKTTTKPRTYCGGVPKSRQDGNKSSAVVSVVTPESLSFERQSTSSLCSNRNSYSVWDYCLEEAADENDQYHAATVNRETKQKRRKQVEPNKQERQKDLREFEC